MKHYVTLLLVAIFWAHATPTAGFSAGITNYPKLNTPDFWQHLAPANQTIVMHPAEIAAFNQKIIAASPSVYDLSTYPTALSAAQLRAWITADKEVLNNTLYQNGTVIDWHYKQTLISECNINALAPQNPVAYGVLVRRTNLRTLPTASGLFESPSDREFDILQETAVDPSEPIIILHSSQSGHFSYIQMRNYRGWVAASDIAQTSRKQWLSHVNPQDFLVVTGNRLALMSDNEQIVYQMGAKIPLLSVSSSGYNVQIPRKNPDGSLTEKTLFITANAPIHHGFLPYSRNQIIRQSFQFLHDSYGWGGLKSSVDCSSFIADIYRTIGIELPRNADEQEQTAGIHFAMEELNTLTRQQTLHALQPGDVLFFDGHTMLYLGETGGTPFIIHSLGSHTKHYADGSREKIRTMQVVISDLGLQRYSGITFMDALTSAISYR